MQSLTVKRMHISEQTPIHINSKHCPAVELVLGFFFNDVWQSVSKHKRAA